MDSILKNIKGRGGSIVLVVLVRGNLIQAKPSFTAFYIILVQNNVTKKSAQPCEERVAYPEDLQCCGACKQDSPTDFSGTHPLKPVIENKENSH